MFHFWSLALEWQFYITFPLALTRIKSPRTAALIAIALALVSRVILIYFSPLNYDNAIYSFTFCRGDALAAGVFLATLSPSKSALKTYLVGALGVFLFTAMLFALAISNIPFKATLWLQTVGYTAIAISIGMFIYFVLNYANESSTIRLLELPAITAIGRASYSLYIWHLPFYPIIVAKSRVLFSDPQSQLIFSVGVATATTWILGALSYKYIESKFMYSRVSAISSSEEKIARI
jgi:peptidoglycan/LPS O-acetylase OafA/YrhL